jgi:murein L,D-transpeptidase YafK
LLIFEGVYILRPVIAHSKLFRLLMFLSLITAASAQTLITAAATHTSIDQVVVLKRQHQLLLMSGDRVVKSYGVALGSGGLTPKRRQGDHRTPEGAYTIDYRNPASRYHLALHISYPEKTDLLRARQLGVNPGGDIMIHGLGPNFSWAGENHRHYDWTDGCIAVTDKEMDEIWQAVADGTPIEIRP